MLRLHPIKDDILALTKPLTIFNERIEKMLQLEAPQLKKTMSRGEA